MTWSKCSGVSVGTRWDGGAILNDSGRGPWGPDWMVCTEDSWITEVSGSSSRLGMVVRVRRLVIGPIGWISPRFESVCEKFAEEFPRLESARGARVVSVGMK